MLQVLLGFHVLSRADKVLSLALEVWDNWTVAFHFDIWNFAGLKHKQCSIEASMAYRVNQFEEYLHVKYILLNKIFSVRDIALTQ